MWGNNEKVSGGTCMTNATSVKDRLKRRAIEEKKTMQDKLVTYGLERTIYRLSISKYETFDQLMNDMNHIIYTSGFVNNIIHSECIIRSMIRDAYDDRKLPDFSNHDVKYKLLKVSSAIEKKDMYTALSFQGLRRLFKTLSIRQRYGTSLYDPFFRISDLY